MRTKKHQAALEWCDPRSESGPESLVRCRFRAAGVAATPQVYIPTVGRVDFKVGELMIVEVDGRRWHDNPAAFEADRHRDRIAMALGFVVVRLSWQTVMFEWESAERDLLEMIRRDEHRRRRGRGI